MEDREIPLENSEPNRRKMAVFASSAVGVVIVLGAVVYSSQFPKTDDSSSVIISASELTTFDGKNGAKCYVAVEKTVYEIVQGKKWKDGIHTTSEG